MPTDSADSAESSVKVRCHDRTPKIVVGFVDRTPFGNACVGYTDRNWSAFGGNICDDIAHFIGLGDIHNNRMQVLRFSGGLQNTNSATGDRNFRTLTCKRARNRKANSRSSARYQRVFAVKVSFTCLLFVAVSDTFGVFAMDGYCS